MRGYRQRGSVLLAVVLALSLVVSVALLLNRGSGMNLGSSARQEMADVARAAAEAGLNHAIWQVRKSNCIGYTDIPYTPFGSTLYQNSFGAGYTATVNPKSGSPVTITVTGTTADGASITLTRQDLEVPGSESSMVLPNNATRDTHIEDGANADNNFALMTNLELTNYGLINTHILFHFDLPVLNPAATFNSAIFTLTLKSIASSNSGTATLFRVTQDWNLMEATWNNAEAVVPWASPGGSYDPTPVASATIDAAHPGPVQWDITSLVTAWYNGTYANNGMLLITSPGIDMAKFNSTENPSLDVNPKLMIGVTCSCGVNCSVEPICNADYSPTGIVSDFSTAGYGQHLNSGVTYFPEGQILNNVTSPPGGAWIAGGDSGILWMVGMDGTELDGGYTTGLSQLEGITFVPAANPTDPGHLAIVKDSSLYYSDMSLPASASFTTHWLPFVTNAGGVSYIDGGTHDGHLAIADMGAGEIHIIDSSFNLVVTLATDSILFAPEGIAHLKYSDKFLVIDTGLSAALVLDTSLTVSQYYDLTPFSLGTPTGAAAAIHPTSCDHFFGDYPNNRYAYLNKGTLILNPVADTQIAENEASVNYGSKTIMRTGVDAAWKPYRTLIQFDVGSIPAGVTVTSVTLRLYMESKFGVIDSNIGVYAITAPWNEATATWTTEGGGAYNPAEELAVTFVPWSVGWVEWSLPVVLIQEWMEGATDNYGLLLNFQGTKQNHIAIFSSLESNTTNWYPQLVIKYTEP